MVGKWIFLLGFHVSFTEGTWILSKIYVNRFSTLEGERDHPPFYVLVVVWHDSLSIWSVWAMPLRAMSSFGWKRWGFLKKTRFRFGWIGKGDYILPFFLLIGFIIISHFMEVLVQITSNSWKARRFFSHKAHLANLSLASLGCKGLPPCCWFLVTVTRLTLRNQWRESYHSILS